MADVQLPSQPAGQTNSTETVIVLASGSVPDPPVLGPADDESELPTYFRMRSRYILDDRVLVAPRMSRPDDPIGFEFARVGALTAALAVDWQSWRKGPRPQKPAPYLADKNCVCLLQHQDFDNLELEGDDKGYWISCGTFWYAFQIRQQATLSHPLPPYIDLPDKNIVVVQASDYVPGMLDAAWVNNASRPAVTQP